MNDCFGIAGGLQAMAAFEERLTQFLIVVNLPVEDDPNRSVLVADRLLARLEVDDAEPPHAEADTRAKVHPFFIRSTMHQHLTHRANLLLEDRFVKSNDSRNATHGQSL